MPEGKRIKFQPLFLAALVVLLFLTSYYAYNGGETDIKNRVSNEPKTAAGPRQDGDVETNKVRTVTTTTTTRSDEVENEIISVPRNDPQVITTPSAPPLFEIEDGGREENNNNRVTPPPPSYNEVLLFKDRNARGRNDLEWRQVFDAFNEKRMAMAVQWTPPPLKGRPLDRCLENVNSFLNADSHPVSSNAIHGFLKAFLALTNLVYVESSAERRRANDVTETATSSLTEEEEEEDRRKRHKEMFFSSFRLLVDEYVPKEPITNRTVPFGYDWFVFSGRITYAVINAHIALCSVTDGRTVSRPYYTENEFVNTPKVVRGLKNLCQNFTESLGYKRYSSNRVYVGTAFLYASVLERAITNGDDDNNVLLPDYAKTLNEILDDPANRYDAFKSLYDEIGRSDLPSNDDAKKKRNVPRGARRGDATYDGVYEDGTFIAHRRLRMYAYVRSYCEQLPSVQLLVREKLLDDRRLAVLLRTVEPMSDGGAMFYFNLHSRTGTFKYRTGSALFAALGLSEYNKTTSTDNNDVSYGRVYAADNARILFVQSAAFTFHSIGQLGDLAYGEVEKSNRDLMPAWLMGQRPLFRSEKNRLCDVPCSAHLEPCVIDTGRSEGLRLGLIGERNTTDYTPTQASSALVAFEDQRIGAVFTSVGEINMDVRYSRCTVATPYYTFTTYFRITRNNDDGDDEQKIKISCYTGSGGAVRDNVADDEIRRRRFEFKHCTIELFVQTTDGKDFKDESVVVQKQQGVEKRHNSKSKYTSEQLNNVSLSLKPYGRNDNVSDPRSLGSVTILYRPNDHGHAPMSKSFASRKILPRVTVGENNNVYRIRVDFRYVLYCDTVRNIVVLLDVVEKRLCLAPILSRMRDAFGATGTDLIEKASLTLRNETLGTIKYDHVYKSRTYAYFD